MATSQAAAATGGQIAQAGPGNTGYPRRWLAAIVMIVGALMDMIDVTIVNVALPSIRRDLNASATQLEWVVSGYMLAFAAALIIAGNPATSSGESACSCPAPRCSAWPAWPRGCPGPARS